MNKPIIQQDAGRLPKALRGWSRIFGFAKDPRSYGQYVTSPSPDGRFMLVFEPGIEFAMMRCQHAFRLVDSNRTVVQAFQGLVSPMQRAWWSPDSRIVAVPIDDRKGGLLLFDVTRQRYSLIPFSSYQETAVVTSTGVRTSVDRSQFEAIFGKEFRPPRDVLFRFAALRWFAAPETGAWKLSSAFRSAPQARWQPPPSKEMRAYAKKHGIGLLRARP
jgi:hypothetical protein